LGDSLHLAVAQLVTGDRGLIANLSAYPSQFREDLRVAMIVRHKAATIAVERLVALTLSDTLG
jgi:hypothetical protein